jgi:hypothetical protein
VHKPENLNQSPLLDGGQGRNRTTDTRIFSEGNGLRLTPGDIYRFTCSYCYQFAVFEVGKPCFCPGCGTEFVTKHATRADAERSEHGT